MKKIIFTYVDEDLNGIFRDLSMHKSENFDFLLSHKKITNKILNILKKISLSYTLNSKFHVPFQEHFYNLDNYSYNPNTEYYLIIPSMSISQFSLNYLKKFKKKHINVHLIALLTDSIHADSPHLNLVRHKLKESIWYKVLTYDKFDAEEFGFTWFGYTYYSNYSSIDTSDIESDIYYVGFEKGNRENSIADLFTNFQNENIKCNFKVVTNKRKKYVKNSRLMYTHQRISYPQVISEVKASNCILEVLQNNQDMQSIRYFEAITCNKKLLSNNKHISELPFYNSKYMKYFEKIEDIDFEWIKRKEVIDYKYNNEFSPIHLLDFLYKII